MTMKQLITYGMAAWQRIQETITAARIVARGWMAARSDWQARVILMTVAGVALLAHPVAAQLDQVGQAMCQNGIGQILGLLFAGATLLYLIKGGLRAMAGLDKRGSPNSGTQQQGNEQLMGSLYSFGGAAIPVILASLFEIVGVSTISCFSFNIGVFAFLVPVNPFGMTAPAVGLASSLLIGHVRR